VITEVDPATVTEGTIALLHGSSFGTDGDLRINGEPVATTSWSADGTAI